MEMEATSAGHVRTPARLLKWLRLVCTVLPTKIETHDICLKRWNRDEYRIVTSVVLNRDNVNTWRWRKTPRDERFWKGWANESEIFTLCIDVKYLTPLSGSNKSGRGRAAGEGEPFRGGVFIFAKPDSETDRQTDVLLSHVKYTVTSWLPGC